jgi:hypothetical protein
MLVIESRQAMAMAMIYPEDSEGGSRGKANKIGFSRERLRQARTTGTRSCRALVCWCPASRA